MGANQTIGILGAGQMGAGIAQTAASSGYRVLLADASKAMAEAGKEKISSGLDRLIKKEKITESVKEDILLRIEPVEGVESFCESFLVIEAIVENEAVKKEVFSKLDEICPKETILCSNTSSISITRIAAATMRADRVAGMHFMNPVPVMKLVEGIRGHNTSDETFKTVREVAEKLGKTFVESEDYPGFIVNRILMPLINEAVFALYEGIGSAQDIDTSMKLGTNQPMGPLELADFIGLDTCLFIMNVLHEGTGDPKFRPCPLLKKTVDAGRLGRKTGEGFHKY